MGKVLRVIRRVLAILAVIIALVYFFVLQYPELDRNLEVGRWHRVSDPEMVCSDGSPYRALFRKRLGRGCARLLRGRRREHQRGDCSGRLLQQDRNRHRRAREPHHEHGGIASEVEGSPFEDWSVIAFPYATGDFHAGAGEFPYTNAEGRERVLYHHGYTNFRTVMDQMTELSGIDSTDTVVVAVYSAGGFASALLADDVFSDYFPAAKSKTTLADSSLSIYDGWRDVAENV